jgi:HSP20 family protein
MASIFVTMPRDAPKTPLIAHDPVFHRIERQMDDLVERLLRRPTPQTYQRAWAPRVDVYETDEQFVAVAELAGVEPGDVTIEIEGEVVTISGKRAAIPPEGSECMQLEIPFGAFERTLKLPCSVDTSSAAADFVDGMLVVRLPKVRRGPTKVQIDVRSIE